MPTFESARAGYALLWRGMAINPGRLDAANQAASRCLAGAARYKTIEGKIGVPWWFVALCHLREGNLNFATYLGNGQPLSRRTTIEPIGRGPFATFEAGAIDALGKMGFTGKPKGFWTIERIMYCLEAFNGFGYRNFGVNSPYLWAGTNRYTAGKYVRDHVFDKSAVDHQLGSMAVLSRMCALNPEVAAAVNGKGDAAVRDPKKDAVIVGGGAAGGAVVAGAQQGWSWTEMVYLGLKVAAIALAAYCLLLLWRRFTAPARVNLPAAHPALLPATIEAPVPRRRAAVRRKGKRR
jgi:lysozyme family protein